MLVFGEVLYVYFLRTCMKSIIVSTYIHQTFHAFNNIDYLGICS